MGWKVVGIGELLWDVLPGGKKMGGAPANFAYHAASLGNDGLLVSCVGDDPDGRELLSALSKLSLSTAHIAVDPPTPNRRGAGPPWPQAGARAMRS